MSNHIFLAISSDKRELYKSDIYRIISKPKGAIEHFRYSVTWLPKNPIFRDRNCLVGQTVIFVFKHVEAGKESIYIPIRKGIIIDALFDGDTDIHHYYFKLEEFCKLKSTPSYIETVFFQEASGLEYETTKWKDIILAVQYYFPQNFFYKVDDVVDKNNKPIDLKHDKVNHSYYYTFFHGNSYTLNLSVANPSKSEQTLSIESSSTDIDVVITKKYYISAPFDKLKIPITTKSLDSFNERSFLSFYINKTDEEILREYENHIHIRKRMRYWKPFWFGILSSSLISCTWLIKDRTDSLAYIFHFNEAVDLPAVTYVLIILLCSSLLYALFNKK